MPSQFVRKKPSLLEPSNQELKFLAPQQINLRPHQIGFHEPHPHTRISLKNSQRFTLVANEASPKMASLMPRDATL